MQKNMKKIIVNRGSVYWYDTRIKKSTDKCFNCDKKIYTDKKYTFAGVPNTYMLGIRHTECKKK